MADTFFTVEGNTSPALEIELKRKKVPISLVDASSVEMTIKNQNTNVVTNTGHKTCSIIDADDGVISYNIQSGDFPSPDVSYTCEVKIIWNSGATERMYNKLNVSIRPNDD